MSHVTNSTMSLYAIENIYRALHLSFHRVSAMISWISFCLATSPQLRCVHDTSRDTSRLLAIHVSWHSIPRLMAFPSMSRGTYFTPCVNQDSHRKFSNFTQQYLHVTTRGLSRMCEVIVELYRMYLRMYIHNSVMKHILLQF